MVKLAQYVQALVILARVVQCAKLVNQDMDYKVINVTHVLQENI